MPIIFEDGFETGDTTKWDGTRVTSGETIEIDSVSPIHGSYSLLCKSADAGPDEYAGVVKKALNRSLVYARCYARINGGLPLPSEGNRINFIIFFNVGNVAVGKSGGIDQFQLRTYNPATKGWVVVNTGIRPEVGRTYCLEYAVQSGQWAKFWIDGKLVAEQDLAGINTYNVGDVFFGLGVTVDTGHTGLSVSTDSCVLADEYIGPIAPPAVVFEDDFETGAFKPEWSITTTTGETATVSSVSPYRGKYHADFECDGLPGTAGEMAYAQLNFTPTGGLYDCYVRQYVKFTKALPPSGKSYIPLNLRTALPSGYALAYLAVSGGTPPKFSVYWVDQAGAHTTPTDITVELDRWYCVELHVKVGAGDGAYELWIDGKQVFTVTGVDNLTARTESPYLGGPVNYIQTGERWASVGAPAHGVYVDEFAVATSYIGPLPAVEHTLTIATTAGGTTDPAPGTYKYPEGTTVKVTAIPASGYSFSHWVLDGGTRTENPINVLMDTDHTITAYFTPIAVGKGTLECHAYVDTTEISATVTVEGVGTYSTPFTVELTAGDYRLTATYAGQTQQKTVTIVAGVTSRVDFTFARPALTGPLEIWTFPVITWVGMLFPKVYERTRTILEDLKKRWRGGT
jgi:hypothetical protein